jgi:hypothetical protein
VFPQVIVEPDELPPLAVAPLDVPPLAVAPLDEALAVPPVVVTPLAVPPLVVTPLAVPPLVVTPLAVPPLVVTPLAVPPLAVPAVVSAALNEHVLVCDVQVPESSVPISVPLHGVLFVSVPLKLTLSPAMVPVAMPLPQFSEMAQPLCVIVHASGPHVPLTAQDPLTVAHPPPFDAEQASPEATASKTASTRSTPRTIRQMARCVTCRS